MKFIHVLLGRKKRVRANLRHVEAERAARAALYPSRLPQWKKRP